LALGTLLSELVTSPPDGDDALVVDLPSGLTWLLIGGCAVAAWLIGYGTGYRRGVNEAINGSVRKPDHQLNEE
jgi:hypothetical protein